MSDPKMVIVVRTDLKLRRGKESAQVAHAAMAWAVKSLDDGFDLPLRIVKDWARGLQKKIVVGVDSLEELQALVITAENCCVQSYVIEDAGLTEIPPGTVTCVAFGPDLPEILDPILGHLKLR
jgi:PTH2 family peptidyl-tRNA hydrolase